MKHRSQSKASKNELNLKPISHDIDQHHINGICAEWVQCGISEHRI